VATTKVREFGEAIAFCAGVIPRRIMAAIKKAR
jgi:hypothetical protein